MPHQISYRPYVGEGSRGAIYGDPVQVGRANVDDKVQKVRGQDAAEVVSSSSVTIDPAWEVPVGSLVTVWAGTHRERESVVITSSYYQHPRVPSHTVLYLT